MRLGSRLAGGIGSEPARFQTTLVALDIVGAQLRQTELPFLKFPADQDEALLFGFAQCLQAGAFRGRLPSHAIGAVQQDHDLYNFVSPWLMHTAGLHRFSNPLVPYSRFGTIQEKPIDLKGLFLASPEFRKSYCIKAPIVLVNSITPSQQVWSCLAIGPMALISIESRHQRRIVSTFSALPVERMGEPVHVSKSRRYP
nr:hypothetical protein [Rhizobium leguminosarum]